MIAKILCRCVALVEGRIPAEPREIRHWAELQPLEAAEQTGGGKATHDARGNNPKGDRVKVGPFLTQEFERDALYCVTLEKVDERVTTPPATGN